VLKIVYRMLKKFLVCDRLHPTHYFNVNLVDFRGFHHILLAKLFIRVPTNLIFIYLLSLAMAVILAS